MNNLIMAIVILFLAGGWASPASGSDAATQDAAAERAKRRLDREKLFLYRSVEELNRALGFVREAKNALDKQVDAAGVLEPSRREGDLRSLSEWYQDYAEFFEQSVADAESDLSRAYSDEQWSGVRSDHNDKVTGGYVRLSSQLDEQLTYLGKMKSKTEERVKGLKDTLEYVTSSSFIEERKKNKINSRTETDLRRNELYDRYKHITEGEIALMRLQLKDLDELQQYYDLLIERGRMERSWISRKTGDGEALSRLARVVGRDLPVAIAEASNEMIKTYESDIAYFKRKIADISRARARIVPSGSLWTLDRAKELTESYDDMKSRYERHVRWLAEQAGAYRADVIELRQDN